MRNYTLKILGIISLVFASQFFLVSYCGNAQFVEERGGNPDQQEEKPTPEYAPGEVLVKFKEGADPGQVLKAINLEIKEVSRIHSIKPAVAKFKKDYKLEKDSEGWYPFLGKKYKEINEIPDEELFKEAYKNMPEVEKALYRSYKMKLPEGVSVEEVISKLKTNPDVEYAEPNYISRVFYVPNDTLYPQQWSHKNTQAERGWDITRGDPNIIIAIIDTGVNYNHEDLSANIWRDADGHPGKDFVDIDTRTYEYEGYELLLSEDYKYIDDNPSDYYGHGTHVAGIAGAVTGNNKGVAGVAHYCKIMPVRAGFAIKYYGRVYGIFENDDMAAGIVYAVENNANIISMSFGSMYKSQLIKEVLDYAASVNVILVAAAGNNGNTIKFYPAAYNNVISVTALQYDSMPLPPQYNYGSWVDIGAPGVLIMSTVLKTGIITDPSGYKKLSGTSMACPYIAGVAALIKSSYPAYTVTEVKTLLYSGAKPIQSRYFTCGAGRVDVYKSLSATSLQPVIAQIQSPQPNEQVSRVVKIEGTAVSVNFSHYTVEFGEGSDPTSWTSSGITLNNGGNLPVADNLLATWDLSGLIDNIYTIKLNVFDTAGSVKEYKVTVKYACVEIGWPQEIRNTKSLARPLLIDLEPDGDLEVIFATYNGELFAWHHDGTVVQGWPIFKYGTFGTPAAGDIDGDGDVEVVVSYDHFYDSGSSIKIFNHDGTEYRPTSPPGWWASYLHTGCQTPILANLDNDGDMEILIAQGSIGGTKVYAWHHTGEVVQGWPVPVGVTPPVVGDIDQDGEPEVITVADKAYAYNADGTPVGGNWPVDVGGCEGVYPNYYPPALGDIDGDKQLEIIVNARDGLFALEGDGTVIWQKVSGGVMYNSFGKGAPALGDLDGDGIPEVVLAAQRHLEQVDGSYLPSKVWVFKGDGTTFGNWPYEFQDTAVTHGAVIADVDTDTEQEVVVAAATNSAIWLYIFNGDGTPLTSYPKQWDMDYESIPAIGNLDGTEGLEIATCGKCLRAYPTPFYVYDLRGVLQERQIDWPMFGRDPQHKGCYPLPNIAPTLNSIGNKTVYEEQFLEFCVTARDPNGDLLSFSAENLPEGATFNQKTRIFTWTPTQEQVGEYQVTFTVSDGYLTNSETITIKVNDYVPPPPPLPPTIEPIADQTIKEGQSLNIPFGVTGTDLNVEAFWMYNGNRLGLPNWMHLEQVGSDATYRIYGEVPYTAAFQYLIRVKASNSGGEATEEFILIVENVGLPPTIEPIGDYTMRESETLRIPVNYSSNDPLPGIKHVRMKLLDEEGDEHILPDWIRISYISTSGARFDFVLEPTYENSGIYHLMVGVIDNGGETIEDFYVTVKNVNRPPKLDPIGDREVNEGSELQIVLNVTDPDGDKPSYSIENKPNGAEFDSETGTFSWTPTYDQAGTYSVTFIASDGELTASETITITVIDTNIISIELNETSWILDGVGLGEKILNKDLTTGLPIHNVTNTGTVTIEIEIGYAGYEGCKPDIKPGLDRFMTALGYMEVDQPIIQPEGYIKMAHMLEPGKSTYVGLVYFSPLELSADIKKMSATYELRAYASTK